MYENILSAINAQRSNPNLPLDNYKAADEASKQGISLSEVMKKVDLLEKEVEELKKRPKDTDPEVFSVMESAVKGDPEVKAMKDRLNSMKLDLLQRYCMTDPTYSAQYTEYTALIGKKYVATKEIKADL